MEHREYLSRAEDDRFALLMIHGIVGSPAHFRDLMPAIPPHWSVYNILLKGHGGTVEDFGRSSMAEWKEQVQTAVEELLRRHRTVVIAAHSMGTLFAIRNAIDRPGRIAALFLLAVPTRPWVRFSTMLTALRVTRPNLSPEDTAAWAMKTDTGTALTPCLWKYIPWLPRMLELLAECRRIRKILPQLETPTEVYQSRVDELVAFSSVRDWQSNPAVKTEVLEHSGHFAYGKEDAELLRQRLQRMLLAAEQRVAEEIS